MPRRASRRSYVVASRDVFGKQATYNTANYRPSRKKPEIRCSANILILAEREGGTVHSLQFPVDGERRGCMPIYVFLYLNNFLL